jgi:hypothetical protein
MLISACCCSRGRTGTVVSVVAPGLRLCFGPAGRLINAECSIDVESVEVVVMGESASASAALALSMSDSRCGRGAAIGNASSVDVVDAPSSAPKAKRGMLI